MAPEIKVIREKDLAAVAVVVGGAALKSRRRSVTEKSTECGCSVAQYIERVSGLRMCGYPAFLNSTCVAVQVR